MRKSFLPLLLLLLTACGQPSSVVESPDWPDIFPDYCGVTIPDDLADLTFAPTDAEHFRIEKTREADTLWYTVTTWSRGKKSGTRYRPFPVYLSHDAIDPYIAYRLIEPGYESWYDMGIYQRQLSSYKETAIVTNRANNRGCINCHTFQGGNPDDMLFHARGAGGGTVFAGGDAHRLVNLKERGPHKQGVYPAWHPGGRYVVFSSNDTHQCFTVADSQPIEVYDTSSDLILMDLATDSIVSPACFTTDSLWETFPSWNPDGRTLYYCAADSVSTMPDGRGRVHYRLMATDFDAEGGQFSSQPQCLFSSDTLSVSFPRLSPDGQLMLFTVARFGTFPIWHREADLWQLDMQSGEARPCDELNSPDTESYHSWSSNGRWVIFSSRRIDGRYTRLFIAHYDGNGHFGKPFLLPQKDPGHNLLRLKSYNIPEFVKAPVRHTIQKI